MKALVVGAEFLDSFSSSIATALKRSGCEVQIFGAAYSPIIARQNVYAQMFWARLVRMVPALEKLVSDRLVRQVARARPDLVLINDGFSPATIRAIRHHSDAIVANWYPDHFANFGRQYLLGSDYHLLFFKDRYIVRFFREKAGIQECHYLPQCCDAELHRPVPLTEADIAKYGCDLTTAGNLYYYRSRLLEPFASYDLKIWGNMQRWMESPVAGRRTGEAVFGLEKARAFRAAKIVLNTMHYAEIHGVNKRTFEAAGCGAFQIADENPALPELFEPDREIVTYTTRKDLQEKVDYYLARPQERMEIAERACRRAHAQHTYDHRVQVILSHVRRLKGEPVSQEAPLTSPPAASVQGGP